MKLKAPSGLPLFAIKSGLTRRGFGAGAFECALALKLLTFLMACGENMGGCFPGNRSDEFPTDYCIC